MRASLPWLSFEFQGGVSEGKHEVQMGKVGTGVAILSWDQFSSQGADMLFSFLRSEESLEKLLMGSSGGRVGRGRYWDRSPRKGMSAMGV